MAPAPFIRIANKAYSNGRFEIAVEHYLHSFLHAPELRSFIGDGLRRAQSRMLEERTERVGSTHWQCRVGVCGWDMGHNAAGRVHTLAQLYRKISTVRVMGFLYRGRSEKVWGPLRSSSMPIEIIQIDALDRFLESALAFVIKNPLDLLHISKPRLPNILMGCLYQLVWHARVYVDVDDEELALVGADTPISLEGVDSSDVQLPPLQFLLEGHWTRLAVGLVSAFDGVTTANSALQKRYGGAILPHFRDEALYQPSAGLRRQTRDRHQIGEERKVVMFLGTPRRHKGLVETAQAISELVDPAVLFVIAGDFPDRGLKLALQQIPRVAYLFLGSQPVSNVPALISMADLCVLLQNEASEISSFQSPAKLTDALAMGVAVLATPAPPLEHAIQFGAVMAAEGSKLSDQLRTLLRRGVEQQRLRINARRYFEQYLSHRACEPHLMKLVCEAKDHSGERARIDRRLSTLMECLGLGDLFALLNVFTDKCTPRSRGLFSCPAHSVD